MTLKESLSTKQAETLIVLSLKVQEQEIKGTKLAFLC